MKQQTTDRARDILNEAMDIHAGGAICLGDNNFLEKFYRAAQLQPKLGEPHYYIGRSYQRIGNQDFDLIIESYNKALSLNLENGLRLLIEEERDLIMNREKRLINFWK